MNAENGGLLCAGQALDEVGLPAKLLLTPRQYLGSETQILNTSYAGIIVGLPFSKTFTMN
jgi:hypothetical protein